MYYTYILYSPKLDKYYVGSTQNIENRLIRHNRGDGSKFTKLGKPWQLYYLEQKASRQEAVAREMEIKRKKSRVYIESLV
jgi:putative endonuclease